MTALRRFSEVVLLRAAAVLFVVALPLALVLSNIRILAFDAAYYRQGYVQNDVAGWTGMTMAQLDEATRQVQAYFRGGPPVSLVVEKVSLRPGNPRWGTEPLFNTREQQHLADVRDLLERAFWVQEAALLYLVGAAALLVGLGRTAGGRRLARWTSVGALVTLGLFAVLGSIALVDFGTFWTQFHVLSFANDLWLLDWETDYMIRLWPPPFWFGAVMDVVIRSAVGAVVLLVLAQLYLRAVARRRALPVPSAA